MNNPTSSQLAAARRKFAPQLQKIPGVVSVGYGLDNGLRSLRIYVTNISEDLQVRIGEILREEVPWLLSKTIERRTAQELRIRY